MSGASRNRTVHRKRSGFFIHNEARSNTKASMLYLTILTETKNMVLQSRNLLKSQQYFLKHLTGPKTWIK